MRKGNNRNFLGFIKQWPWWCSTCCRWLNLFLSISEKNARVRKVKEKEGEKVREMDHATELSSLLMIEGWRRFHGVEESCEFSDKISYYKRNNVEIIQIEWQTNIRFLPLKIWIVAGFSKDPWIYFGRRWNHVLISWSCKVVLSGQTKIVSCSVAPPPGTRDNTDPKTKMEYKRFMFSLI